LPADADLEDECELKFYCSVKLAKEKEFNSMMRSFGWGWGFDYTKNICLF